MADNKRETCESAEELSYEERAGGKAPEDSGIGKTIIIINGKGGSGKDAFVDAASACWRVWNVSSIDPVKEAARVLGWSGEKDDASRRFLSELKEATTRYNDYTTRYLMDKAAGFMESGGNLLFLHVREPENIKKLSNLLVERGYNIKTLLVRRPETEGREYGNASDDGVEAYQYDLEFSNDVELESLRGKVEKFIRRHVFESRMPPRRGG